MGSPKIKGGEEHDSSIQKSMPPPDEPHTHTIASFGYWGPLDRRKMADEFIMELGDYRGPV